MARCNQGRAFESSVDAIAKAYATQGVLTLEKVEPPVRIVGAGKASRVIFLENPFLDYVGTWTRKRGRSLFIEAKDTAEPKLPFGGGGLTEKQIGSLERWELAGAAVGVLWSHRGIMRYVGTDAIRARLRQRIRHIKWEHATDIPQGLGFVFWDFEKTLARYYPD